MNPRIRMVCLLALCSILSGPAIAAAQARSSREDVHYEYKLLATNKTSTMQKELNEAATEGYRFEDVMGGSTYFGGQEVVSILSRPAGMKPNARYEYKLLATSKTSTMQKELQEAGDAGFEYAGQTVFDTAFGGDEVVVILERDREEANLPKYEYRLLATKKTSTMQKELAEAAQQGFMFVGVTVSKTHFGGSEVVTILRRLPSSEASKGK
ncbi:MAG TPA: hypothetical protein VNN18_00255 [Candidatus Xenobia bacterium]|nr:hypothetical protein [Candidatus Xenobia bacterium]